MDGLITPLVYGILIRGVIGGYTIMSWSKIISMRTTSKVSNLGIHDSEHIGTDIVICALALSEPTGQTKLFD